MSKKIGFIGCGNMGTAMMQGILESGKCSSDEIMISCRTQATLDAKKEQFGDCNQHCTAAYNAGYFFHSLLCHCFFTVCFFFFIFIYFCLTHLFFS